MVVNAFWFGFLIGVITMIVLLLVIAFVNLHVNEQQEDDDQEELQKIIDGMDGKNFFVMTRNGYLVGEEIKDKDEHDE